MARRAIGPLTTLAVFGLALPALAQEASLPGGASTLNETHGALTVICAIGTQAESSQVLCYVPDPVARSDPPARACH